MTLRLLLALILSATALAGYGQTYDREIYTTEECCTDSGSFNSPARHFSGMPSAAGSINKISTIKRFSINGIYYGVIEYDPTAVIVISAVLHGTNTLTIPETITYEGETYIVKIIGSAAFYNDNPRYEPPFPIKTLEVPSTVCEIEGPAVFGAAIDFESINVDERNQWYSSLNGILYSKDFSILLGCPCKNPCVGIAQGVKKINGHAFSSCRGVKEIDLPSTVTYIGISAFSGSALSRITLPSSLKYIGPGAFSSTNLTSIRIGAEIEYLGESSLECYKLESVYCESPIPLKCQSSPFVDPRYYNDHIYNHATLYVPAGSIDAYRSANHWRNFKTIKEYEYSSEIPAETSGIDIRTDGDAIIVSGNESYPIEIYRTDGSLVRSTTESRIDGLSSGLYIVKVQNTVKKIPL